MIAARYGACDHEPARRLSTDPVARRQAVLGTGSFSGFLIRRFGWDAYRRFYCDALPDEPFDPTFKWHFGLTLEEAEGQWRSELLDEGKAPQEEWWQHGRRPHSPRPLEREGPPPVGCCMTNLEAGREAGGGRRTWQGRRSGP